MRIILALACLAVLALIAIPAMAADDAGQESNPWYWYNKAVDLAYEGKFTDAYDANERALALNATMPLALANKAGILVQLKRYDEAIAVADALLQDESTAVLPNARAAAYYSKGDALRALGRIDEAGEAYAEAYALDNTLVPPEMTPSSPATGATFPPTTATKSPLPVAVIIGALGIAGCMVVRARQD